MMFRVPMSQFGGRLGSGFVRLGARYFAKIIKSCHLLAQELSKLVAEQYSKEYCLSKITDVADAHGGTKKL